MSSQYYHLKASTWERLGRNTTKLLAPYLPWDLTAIYPTTSKPVGAHYFTQFPLRVSITYDYSRRFWNQPGDYESGKDHTFYGGYTRDHPLNTRYLSTATGAEVRDMKIEVRQAIAGRIDGWVIDMLDLDTTANSQWTKMLRMCQAVDEVNNEDGTNFWVTPMPDGTAQGVSGGSYTMSGSTYVVDANASADLLGDKLNQLNTTYNCLYKPGGRLLIAPFAPEHWPHSTSTNQTDSTRPAFWQRVKNRLETAYSTPTDIWMCYNESWTASQCAPAMNSFCYGHGRWGLRDPDSNNGDNNSARQASQYCWNTYSKPWMHWASPGDNRPRSAVGSDNLHYQTSESFASQALDSSWKAAIGDATHRPADFVQIPTWNDYTEHAHICPSENNGYALVDLNTYYVECYKTGSYPTIVRDGLYLMHRLHLWDVALDPASKQQRRAALAGATAKKDKIEVRAFLTAPATIEIMRNGTVIASTTAANSHVGDNTLTANLAPVVDGDIISARAVRAGVTVLGTSVTSGFPLQATPMVDDMQYRAMSSLRQGSFS